MVKNKTTRQAKIAPKSPVRLMEPNLPKNLASKMGKSKPIESSPKWGHTRSSKRSLETEKTVDQTLNQPSPKVRKVVEKGLNRKTKGQNTREGKIRNRTPTRQVQKGEDAEPESYWEDQDDEVIMGSAKSLIKSIKRKRGAKGKSSNCSQDQEEIDRSRQTGQSAAVQGVVTNETIRNDGVEIEVSTSEDDYSDEAGSDGETETDHSAVHSREGSVVSSYQSESSMDQSELDDGESEGQMGSVVRRARG